MKASILILTILGMIAINVVTGGPIEDPKQEASSENININATISDIDVHSRRKRSKDAVTTVTTVLWPKEVDARCTPNYEYSSVDNQAECQDLCLQDSYAACVGISYYPGNCRACWDFQLLDEDGGGFGFYRRPVICNDNLPTSNVQEIAANRKSECKDCGTSKSKCDSSQCILDEGWIWNSCVAKNG